MAGIKGSEDTYARLTAEKNHRDHVEGRLKDLTGSVSRLTDRILWLENALIDRGVKPIPDHVKLSTSGRWTNTENYRKSPFLAST